MREYPLYYVESGDLFSFQRERNPQGAAEHHVSEVMRVAKATFGEKIVVKNNYRGKIVGTFPATEIIEKFNSMNDIKYKLVGNRIHFTKLPFSRSSMFEYWQNLHRVGVEMVNMNGRWVQSSAVVNPITSDFTGM